MKIAIVMPLAEQRGGAELALIHFVRYAARAGIAPCVAFLEDGPMVGACRDLGAEVAVVPAGRLRQPHRMAACVVRLSRVLRRWRPDAVVSWMSKAHLYGGLAGALARVPAVWFQHGIPDPHSFVDRLSSRLPARGVLACSRTAAAAQAALSPGRRVEVVYPGVESDLFDPAVLPAATEARARLGLSAAGPLVGIVARLQRWKGVHVVIEAMPRVLAAHPGARLVVVGGAHSLEPDYPAFVECRIRELGLGERVILAGFRDDVPLWMAAMDVVVHASDVEPFGMVVVEAMCLGKPVVAGTQGGPSEIITPGKDGLLAPFGDADALAAAILRYLDDPSFAAGISRAAVQRAADFFADTYARRLGAAVRSFLHAPVEAPNTAEPRDGAALKRLSEASA